MPGRYGDLNYPKLTKQSFLFGVGLFAIGAAGELALSASGASVPGWEQALLLDAELVGVAIALLAPFVFGIFLPLTE
ncbi:hypothetical protein EXE46_03575 [Halorubrum sp. GN11_10-6_MGM]|uniref:DUF7860 family protein n=1 Tax=Halorubrum sp. GN11_10-6_MGM TaxID=2518112 RepID=UPI0010F6997D|nr:hypothetical protein [Halorubrum sp. GN11_10-6_MGM]TKX75539.1 hypothetical protein EXE46_03575 [Halorubrum sp. GN11_10-6_MGM]